MKPLLIIPIVVFLLTPLTGCKENDPTGPDDLPKDGPVAEAVIGAEGGTIATQDFSLTVPPGAFTSNVSLSLYIEENNRSFVGERVSNTYKLTGLNAEWNKPLSLKLKYNGTLHNEKYIALGYNHYFIELEESTLVYDLLAAADTLGYMHCTIPEIQTQDYLGKSNSPGIEIHPSYYFFILGVSKISTHTSGVAQIKYNAGYDKARVERLGNYFDEAVGFFATHKLIDPSAFSQSKLKVRIRHDEKQRTTVQIVEPEMDMLHSTDPLLLSYTFNKLIAEFETDITEKCFETADENKLRLIAAHSVYRFVRCFILGSEKNWFDWATGFWVDEYFYGGIPDFRKRIINSSLYLQPFHGMVAGQTGIPTGIDPFLEYSLPVVGHGFGMSSFIKFLMTKYDMNNELLRTVYSEIIRSPAHSRVDAILNSIEAPEYVWWPEFFKDYLDGTIWNITGEDFVTTIHSLDQLHIIDATDTIKHFVRSYPDLSAKLCRISLSENVFQEGDGLNFSIDSTGLNPDYVTVLIYGYKNGRLYFLAQGNNLTLSNTKGLRDEGYSALIAAVVNSSGEYPYTGTMTIDLMIRKVAARVWKWDYVNIVISDITSDVEIFSPSYQRYDTLYARDLTFGHHPFKVEKQGNSLTGTRDEIVDYGTYQARYTGTIHITIDESTLDVIHFSISDTTAYDNYVNIWEAEGGDIPFYWSSETSLQQHLGNNVRAHLDKLNWYRIDGKDLWGEQRLRLLKIVSDSKARIEFHWMDKFE